jgi:hypothetical protein
MKISNSLIPLPAFIHALFQHPLLATLTKSRLAQSYDSQTCPIIRQPDLPNHTTARLAQSYDSQHSCCAPTIFPYNQWKMILKKCWLARKPTKHDTADMSVTECFIHSNISMVLHPFRIKKACAQTSSTWSCFSHLITLPRNLLYNIHRNTSLFSRQFLVMRFASLLSADLKSYRPTLSHNTGAAQLVNINCSRSADLVCYRTFAGPARRRDGICPCPSNKGEF